MYTPSRLGCKCLAQFRSWKLYDIITSWFLLKPPVIHSPMQQKVEIHLMPKDDSCPKMVHVSNYLNVTVDRALSESIEKTRNLVRVACLWPTPQVCIASANCIKLYWPEGESGSTEGGKVQEEGPQDETRNHVWVARLWSTAQLRIASANWPQSLYRPEGKSDIPEEHRTHSPPCESTGWARHELGYARPDGGSWYEEVRVYVQAGCSKLYG